MHVRCRFTVKLPIGKPIKIHILSHVNSKVPSFLSALYRNTVVWRHASAVQQYLPLPTTPKRVTVVGRLVG